MASTPAELRRTTTLFHNAEAGNVDGKLMDLDKHLGSFLAVHLVAEASWNGTANFEGTIDGTEPWTPVQGEKVSNGSLVITGSGITLNEIFRFDVAGLAQFRVRIDGRIVGTLTARGRGVNA